MTASRRRTAGLALILTAVVLLAGCGSSSVDSSAYVKSVCVALGNWRNTIQSAGVALQSSGASQASRPVAKLDYQRFVSSLVLATQRATNALRAAGAPSVKGGTEIAERLTSAFERATHGLSAASARAKAIPTDSSTAFRLGAGAVNSEISAALKQIASVSPGQSQELRSAAAKQPECQVLASG